MICHTRKALFIHIPKTGGNSVNRVLGVEWENHKDLARHASEEAEEHIRDYYKFAIVRNPWDRLLSDFNFQNRKSRGTKLFLHDENGKKRTFAQWIDAGFAEPDLHPPSEWGGKVSDHINRFSPQVDWLKLDGVLMMDFTARLDRINDDFPKICDALGIPPRKLPKRNSRFHWHYSRYYTDELARRVAKYYEEDIDTFGFTFGK